MGEYAPDTLRVEPLATAVVNGASDLLYNKGISTADPLEWQYFWYEVTPSVLKGYPKAIWVLPDLARIDMGLGNVSIIPEAQIGNVILYKQVKKPDGSLEYVIKEVSDEIPDPALKDYPGLNPLYVGGGGSMGEVAYLDLSKPGIFEPGFKYFVSVSVLGSDFPWPLNGRFLVLSTEIWTPADDPRKLAYGNNYVQDYPLIYNNTDVGDQLKIVNAAGDSILFYHGAAAVQELMAAIGVGQMTKGAAIEKIVQAADATTSVASLGYQFFTGKIPSKAGFDYLVNPLGPNPNNINSAYYQSFGLENRYINFAVNLGKVGEGKDAFAQAYGALDLFAATKKAYATIFGATPTDAKVHALLDPTFMLNGVAMSRAQYFAYYGGDGPNGQGTKAAMVGWLLAEAEKADLGMYAKSNHDFLVDLADGANFAIDLVAVYGKSAYVLT